MSIHERIAAALGWTLRDVNSMSMQSLRELVRPVDPSLAADITQHITSGAYIVRRG